MTSRDGREPDSAEKTVRDIRRATRRKLSAEEKIRIVLESLGGEWPVAEQCRKEGIAPRKLHRPIVGVTESASSSVGQQDL